MIPKKIHYIWLGGEKNLIAKKAINTWRQRAPEYQIVEWNDHNLPNYSNKFYQNALANHDYAFASDYARLKILQKYGGIYMDTDMYLLKSPNKILNNKDLVFSIQNADLIFSTCFIAAKPEQDFINRAVLLYDHLLYAKGHNKPNTEILSPLMFEEYSFEHKDKTQTKGKIVAFSSDILLQPSFKAVSLHIGEKAWTTHDKHDQMRIKMRQYIKNPFEAGMFRIVNDIARRII